MLLRLTDGLVIESPKSESTASRCVHDLLAEFVAAGGALDSVERSARSKGGLLKDFAEDYRVALADAKSSGTTVADLAYVAELGRFLYRRLAEAEIGGPKEDALLDRTFTEMIDLTFASDTTAVKFANRAAGAEVLAPADLTRLRAGDGMSRRRMSRLLRVLRYTPEFRLTRVPCGVLVSDAFPEDTAQPSAILHELVAAPRELVPEDVASLEALAIFRSASAEEGNAAATVYLVDTWSRVSFPSAFAGPLEATHSHLRGWLEEARRARPGLRLTPLSRSALAGEMLRLDPNDVLIASVFDSGLASLSELTCVAVLSDSSRSPAVSRGAPPSGRGVESILSRHARLAGRFDRAAARLDSGPTMSRTLALTHPRAAHFLVLTLPRDQGARIPTEPRRENIGLLNRHNEWVSSSSNQPRLAPIPLNQAEGGQRMQEEDESKVAPKHPKPRGQGLIGSTEKKPAPDPSMMRRFQRALNKGRSNQPTTSNGGET